MSHHCPYFTIFTDVDGVETVDGSGYASYEWAAAEAELAFAKDPRIASARVCEEHEALYRDDVDEAARRRAERKAARA